MHLNYAFLQCIKKSVFFIVRQTFIPHMVVEVLIAHPPQVYKYTMWVQAIMTAHLIGGKSPRNPEGDGGRQMFERL